MNTNYSFETSYPAYISNQAEKYLQSERVYDLVKAGYNNLLELSEVLGLESGRISARVNDLIKDGKVCYNGTVTYKERLRKRIVLIGEGKQQNLF